MNKKKLQNDLELCMKEGNITFREFANAVETLDKIEEGTATDEEEQKVARLFQKCGPQGDQMDPFADLND